MGADLVAVSGSYARGNENNQHQPDGTYYLGSGRSGGYAVMNLSARYAMTRNVQVFGQINNLFDREYAVEPSSAPRPSRPPGGFGSPLWAG
jgi:outer membrane receptor protein involved in Fe transport